MEKLLNFLGLRPYCELCLGVPNWISVFLLVSLEEKTQTKGYQKRRKQTTLINLGVLPKKDGPSI